MIVPVLPRFDRPPIVPQTTLVQARIALGIGELAHLFMFRMVPAIAGADLVEIDMSIADINAAAVPAFAVHLDGIKSDVFAGDSFPKAFPRVVPIRLSVFRRIHAV